MLIGYERVRDNAQEDGGGGNRHCGVCDERGGADDCDQQQRWSCGHGPVYTGTSTEGNSPISVSGGNVGIGTTNPASGLTVQTEGPDYSDGSLFWSIARIQHLVEARRLQE